jgi:hypothetical protein
LAFVRSKKPDRAISRGPYGSALRFVQRNTCRKTETFATVVPMNAAFLRCLSLLCLATLLALMCVQPRVLSQQGGNAANALMSVVAEVPSDDAHGPVDPAADDGSAWGGLPDLPDDTHDVAQSNWTPHTVLHAPVQSPAPARFDAHVATLLRPPSA